LLPAVSFQNTSLRIRPVLAAEAPPLLLPALVLVPPPTGAPDAPAGAPPAEWPAEFVPPAPTRAPPAELGSPLAPALLVVPAAPLELLRPALGELEPAAPHAPPLPADSGVGVPADEQAAVTRARARTNRRDRVMVGNAIRGGRAVFAVEIPEVFEIRRFDPHRTRDSACSTPRPSGATRRPKNPAVRRAGALEILENRPV